jgi:hypothetical protein
MLLLLFSKMDFPQCQKFLKKNSIAFIVNWLFGLFQVHRARSLKVPEIIGIFFCYCCSEKLKIKNK